MNQNNIEDFSIIDWDLWGKIQNPRPIETEYNFTTRDEAKKIAMENSREFKIYVSEIVRCANKGEFSAKFTEMNSKVVIFLESLGYQVGWMTKGDGYWIVKWD